MKNNLEINIKNICNKAKKASSLLANNSGLERNRALKLMSNAILNNKKQILAENKKDIRYAKSNKINENFLDRLLLTEERIENMAKDIKNIANLPDPLNRILNKTFRPNGLKIYKVSVPLGVIAVIFESRPNVACDVAALCIKSGNSVILKGGREAKYTTEYLITLIKKVLSKTNISSDTVSSLKSYDRAATKILFNMNETIDVLIPRGGKKLIESVRKESSIPLFSHLDGICHTYIDKFAKIQMAVDIAINAKMRRTSICGATETILCHSAVADDIIPVLIKKLQELKCEVKGDYKVIKYDKNITKAVQEDWSTEYLDAVVSVKIVPDLQKAIAHINKYSSGHTDAIITEDNKNANQFLESVESAIVMHNTSTQFADGAEFGLGAEIGISTGKLHARGPVGLEGLTTYKYIVKGKGQLRT